MTEIERVVLEVSKQQRALLSDSTFVARRCYFNQLLKTASGLGIEEPCQELYDKFTAGHNGSKNKRFFHEHCVKLVDAYAGTHAFRQNGMLYNEPALPTVTDTLSAFEGISYPLGSLEVDFLIVKAELEMRHLGLSGSTIGQYRHAWMDIHRHFFLQGSNMYCEAVLMKYIDHITSLRDCGRIKEWKWKIERKAAHVLIEVADTGHFRWKVIRKDLALAQEELEALRCSYLLSLKDRNLQKATINLHDYVFRNALEYAQINSLDTIRALSLEHVQSMIKSFSLACNKRSLSTIVPILRNILNYLYIKGITESRLSDMVIGVFVQRGNVASYLSRSDEVKVMEHLNQCPKRDKAIVLLALRLGLRDSDICNLRFQEIRWRDDKICLTQKKTGKPLVLPLLPDVGNALVDYIMDERPSREDGYPYVFLRKQAPHNKLASTYPLFSSLARRLEIAPENGCKVGSHLYRYTLVHRLLSARTPHQVITDVLGHTSKESDKPYLSMDESMLRMCALDLSIVGKISWEEGGSNG